MLVPFFSWHVNPFATSHSSLILLHTELNDFLDSLKIVNLLNFCIEINLELNLLQFDGLTDVSQYSVDEHLKAETYLYNSLY